MVPIFFFFFSDYEDHSGLLCSIEKKNVILSQVLNSWAHPGQRWDELPVAGQWCGIENTGLPYKILVLDL